MTSEAGTPRLLRALRGRPVAAGPPDRALGTPRSAAAALASLPYVVMAVVVVAAGLLAVAVRCALGAYDGLFEQKQGFAALASVAGVTAAAVIAATARQRREAELAGARSIAEVAQRVPLRPVPRRDHGIGHITDPMKTFGLGKLCIAFDRRGYREDRTAPVHSAVAAGRSARGEAGRHAGPF